MFGAKNFDQIMSTFSKAKNELEDLIKRCTDKVDGLKTEKDKIELEMLDTKLEKAKATNAKMKIEEFFAAGNVDPADVAELPETVETEHD
jgi:DNA anti-recombination protein RmuC